MGYKQNVMREPWEVIIRKGLRKERYIIDAADEEEARLFAPKGKVISIRKVRGKNECG